MYVRARINEENVLLTKYALKSKREVWKTLAKINYFRSRAKDLAKASNEEQQVLFGKLQKMGLNTHSISDVLALKIENLLERRLPTVVYKKGLAATPQQARQLVVHKKVLIDGKAVNIPSYLVAVDEEAQITIKPAAKKPEAAPEAPKTEASA